MEKVLTMLKDLQTEVVVEGRAEAKTYDKFACFCKDVTAEKEEAITEGQTEQDQLMADISDLTAKREELDDKMLKLEEKISKIEKKLKSKMEKRQKGKSEYEKEEVELSGAITAVEMAIGTLKASRPASFAEIKSVLAVADAFEVGDPKTKKALSAIVTSLHQPDVPMQNYEFKSEEVIELLEKLLDDFKDEKADLDEAEVKEQASHDSLVQEKTSLLAAKKKEYDDAKEDKASTSQEISQKSAQVTTVSATLLDDQEYMKDLHAKCEDKSKMFEECTKVRADELGALTQAIQIITDLMDKGSLLQISTVIKTLKKPLLFVQNSQTPPSAQLESVKEEEFDDKSISFLQLEKPRRLLAVLSHRAEAADQATSETSTEMGRQEVVSLLRSKAKELRSELLGKLADKVEADPFKKIKKLIEELIERLKQEAADEASHKGWCDEEMGKAKRTRSEKSEEILKLNTKLGSAEALRDKLTEQVDLLEKELKELEAELEKQTKLRDDEKEENKSTIKEAEEARDAVKEAIKVLKEFYEKAGKGDADYKGSDKGGGIIAMLDVIKSDFERTMSETEEAEKQADQDFMEFERVSKNSKKTKETAKEEKGSELERTEGNIEDDMESLEKNQKTLDDSLNELQELHQACIDTGMSAEERAALREEEMAALKQALCILDKSGPVQTEDMAGEC